MLFVVVQRHTEETCGAFSTTIRGMVEANWPMENVTVHGAYAASHAHTWYFILESASYEAIWKGLGPFRELSTAEIMPVHPVTQISAATPYPYDEWAVDHWDVPRPG